MLLKEKKMIEQNRKVFGGHEKDSVAEVDIIVCILLSKYPVILL